MKHVEIIRYKSQVFALLIKKEKQFKKNGVNFLTNNKDLIQLGFLKHKKNHKIKSHIHNKNRRIINYCSEVLIVKSGKLKVIFYNNKGLRINVERILKKDDIIILFKGGHGFEILKDCKIIEIKQSPYNSQVDKVIFDEK